MSVKTVGKNRTLPAFNFFSVLLVHHNKQATRRGGQQGFEMCGGHEMREEGDL